MDPKGSLDLTPLIEKASVPSKTEYEFVFPGDKNFDVKVTSDVFSTIPLELQARILEMLPTDSVMDLFLASPAFRKLAQDLPPSFWKSRILFDLPWCAGIALEQIAATKDRNPPLDRLYRQLKEASQCDCWDAEEGDEEEKAIFDKNSLGLRNRRRIWLNCERTLKAIESRQGAIRDQAGTISPVMSQLTTSKLVSISTKSPPEATLDVYMVPGPDKKGYLKDIIAHFADDDHIIGIEFQLLNEESGRLFGSHGSKTSRITVEAHSAITAIMISFGSLDREQDGTDILGLGIVFEDQPLKPGHVLGAWNDQDVIHILRSGSGMEIVGITGEFNVSSLSFALSPAVLWY